MLIALQMLKENSEDLSRSVAFVNDAKSTALDDHTTEQLEALSAELGVVLALLGAGADVNVANTDGLFPLHVAATIANQYGVYALKKILGKAQGRDMLYQGMSALSLAVTNGNVAGAQILIEEGADANCLVEDSRSILQLVLTKANESLFEAGARLDLARALLGSGANPLQKVNIALAGCEMVMGLVMDQAYAEYEPREKGRKEQAKMKPSADGSAEAGSAGKFSASEEWPIMDLLVESMRETNKTFIMKNGKAMEKFCEECGRSNGVPFHSCNRCGMVVFCRDKCKMRSFSTHHRGVCVTYRRLRGMDTWGDDGDATQWKPRKVPEGKQFELENWQRSAARPFKLPEGFESPDQCLSYTGIVRSAPIRTTSRNGTSKSNHVYDLGDRGAVNRDGVQPGKVLANALLDNIVGDAGGGSGKSKVKVRIIDMMIHSLSIFPLFVSPSTIVIICPSAVVSFSKLHQTSLFTVARCFF